MKHLVQDFDGDGVFDNYFHLKTMSINGNYAGNRSGYAVLNGSANWSSSSARSDENLGVFYTKKRALRYQGHFDYWYNNFPSTGSNARSTTSARPTTGDQLVFGSGKGAVYEDGTPVSTDGTNPFRKRAKD